MKGTLFVAACFMDVAVGVDRNHRDKNHHFLGSVMHHHSFRHKLESEAKNQVHHVSTVEPDDTFVR
jgi:hypothetical protein